MNHATYCIKPQLQFNVVAVAEDLASSDGSNAQFQMFNGCCSQGNGNSEGNGSDATPSGAVMYFAAEEAPKGWLKADGTAYSKTEYAKLFAVVGDAFRHVKNVDEATFNVPDLRGEFLRGWDNERGVDDKRALGSAQHGSIITEEDTGDAVQNALLGNTPAAWGFDKVDVERLANLKVASTIGNNRINQASTFPTLFGVARPRNIALLACIKA